MANLKRQVLGKVSGSLGDIVFRQRNGKNILGLKPSSYNLPQDPASVARRGKFRIATKLAAAINSNAQLKSIWKLQAPSGLSVANYVLQSNYAFLNPETLGNSILLVPAGGFPFTVTAVDKTSSQIQVTASAIGTNNGIDTEVEVKVQMLSLLFMSNPSGENASPYTFSLLSSGKIDISLTEQLVFTSPLNGSETMLYDQYQDHTVYFALLTLDAEEKIIHHSITLNG